MEYSAPRATLLEASIIKLVEVLEQENASLRNYQITSHAGFADRKNTALRELMAAQKGAHLLEDSKALAGHLRRLSQCLRENTSLLKLHISAVGEISDIFIATLRDADWDGTYTRSKSYGGE